MDATILESFLANVAEAPERLAFVHADQRLSFGELNQRSLKVAAGLARAGVGRGMPVGILVMQGMHFPVACLALWRLGAIVVPFDPGGPAEDRAARESIIELAFMIADTDLLLQRSTTRVLPISELERADALALPSAPALDDDCLYMFTSGTTGRAKALLHTHASLSHIVRRNIDLGRCVIRDDIVLATIPLQLALGLANLVFSPLVAGATVVLVQPFSPRVALQIALKWRVTSVVTVPAIVKLLAALPETLGRPALRRVNVASAHLDASAYESFLARYGIRPVRSYGMSEIGRIASTGVREESSYRPIVGWPLLELRLLDDEGREVPPGETGEVAVRAASLCRTYCLTDAGAREPLPMAGDFFLTGDIGRLEADGALALVGRKKSFINGPRLRVDPREVEEVVRRIKGVRDVAVLPAPGRDGYEAIHAFIAADDTVREATVAAYCADHLPQGKRPQIVDFVEAVPRNASGKVEAWRLRGRGATRP